MQSTFVLIIVMGVASLIGAAAYRSDKKKTLIGEETRLFPVLKQESFTEEQDDQNIIRRCLTDNELTTEEDYQRFHEIVCYHYENYLKQHR